MSTKTLLLVWVATLTIVAVTSHGRTLIILLCVIASMCVKALALEAAERSAERKRRATA